MILALKDLLLGTSGLALQDLLLAPADLMSSMSSSIRSLMSTLDKASVACPSVPGFANVQPANVVNVRAKQNGAVLTATRSCKSKPNQSYKCKLYIVI